MKKRIYLDYNSTTPMDPAVYETVARAERDVFGNPSSQTHGFGWDAQMALETARKEVADLIGAQAREIVFTSGATESNNLALLGILKKFKGRPHHAVSVATEHKAVLDVLAFAQRDFGTEITLLPVDQYGQVNANEVQGALKPHTQLVSVMLANNEIGTLQPISKIAKALGHKAIFHCDAAQGAGKVPIEVANLGVDLLSISGHKMYGPKGVGALYVRTGLDLDPIMAGGGQERGLRPGTQNLPGIVGLGAACKLLKSQLAEDLGRLTALRDKMIKSVLEECPSVRLNGHSSERVYSNVSFTFPNLPADLFSEGLGGLAVSSGSACASGSTSHVLKALGHSEALAKRTLRIGLGRPTTEEEIDLAVQVCLKLGRTH